MSYARTDESVVDQLQRDLETAGHRVWYDRTIQGGQDWWEVILERIRGCDLFVFVLSPTSARSVACRAELDYAHALNRPLVPVRVLDVKDGLAPDPIPSLQIVDFRSRTPENMIGLISAVTAIQINPRHDAPVPPPAAPIQSYEPIHARLAQASLPFEQQQDLIQELEERLGYPDEQVVILALLDQLRTRPDVIQSIGRRIDDLVHNLGATAHDDPASLDLLRSLVTQIRRGHFTPILGWGLTDSLIVPRRLLARRWAQIFEFPMASHQQDDLAQVARFVAVMTDTMTLRESLVEFFEEQLRSRYSAVVPSESASSLDELLDAAWSQKIGDGVPDIHAVLAGLPCSLYVTAHPTNILAHALRRAGREPRVELCRWRPDVYDWPESVFTSQSNYVPDVQHPLVYHIFGNLDFADSLVFTEDDYIEFGMSIAANPALIPLVVRDALADSALLLLGFGLEQWDLRVLLRALVNQQGAQRLKRYTHVAAQIDLDDEVAAPARARRYLERYFGKFLEPAIDIYWGSVDEFAARLDAVWTSTP